MSRVVYTNTQDAVGQETLRTTHRVRIVTAEEEGGGVNALPAGVYGYTYSPGLVNAPLFTTRRYRSFEIHKLPEGEVFVIGFVTAEAAQQLSSALTDVSIQLQSEPDEQATLLATIPYSRIRQHRQYAAPNQQGFSVTVTPDLKQSAINNQ